MESESINCIVTSPPYYSLRNYQIDGQIGLEETAQEYVDTLCAVFDELHRVLKKDGLFFLNIGDTYYSGKGESQGIDRNAVGIDLNPDFCNHILSELQERKR
jgi:DNA modification methylase